jgi:hypothetical protein
MNAGIFIGHLRFEDSRRFGLGLQWNLSVWVCDFSLKECTWFAALKAVVCVQGAGS